MGKGAEFLREAGVYFIATSDEGQPQLRPFGSNMEYNGEFYFSMGRSKNVIKQMISWLSTPVGGIYAIPHRYRQ